MTFADLQPARAPAEGGEEEVLFQPGDWVAGLYEIRSVIGSGGMGQVFEAHDLALDRRVALKAAWPDVPVSALHQEARALAALRHPALPTVHAIGTHRGIDYIVMERIYGVSLEDHLNHRAEAGESFAIDEVVWLMRMIAEGLAVVHMAGIAHRDVKPANVMLTPDRRVVLMDFGLMVPEAAMKFQQDIAGSPAYMAPEAIDNVLIPGAGQLLDVFGLGVTAYELLTGRLPFDAMELEQIRAQQEQGPPDLTELRPSVPAGLATLITDMMSPDPSQRPESAESVLWQLRALTERKRATSRSGPVRVMVVDDDKAIATLMTMIVKQAVEGCEVFAVHNGDAALKQLRSNPPDVMVLDIHMPRLNGVEVVMYVRGAGIAPDCAIIAVSAGAQNEDRQLLYHLGIREFITKGKDLRSQVTQSLQRVLRPAPEVPAGR